jgi:hypothetical protein
MTFLFLFFSQYKTMESACKSHKMSVHDVIHQFCNDWDPSPIVNLSSESVAKVFDEMDHNVPLRFDVVNDFHPDIKLASIVLLNAIPLCSGPDPQDSQMRVINAVFNLLTRNFAYVQECEKVYNAMIQRLECFSEHWIGYEMLAKTLKKNYTNADI